MSHLISCDLCLYLCIILYFFFHFFLACVHLCICASCYYMRGELEIVQNALSNKTIYVLLTANDHCSFCSHSFSNFFFFFWMLHSGKSFQRGIAFELHQWNTFKLLLVFDFLGNSFFLHCWRLMLLIFIRWNITLRKYKLMYNK